jgi:hypothetical protein
MRKRRPCRICRCWFLPDKHVGDRQKVCSRESCQRERHRRESVVYRRRERDKVREQRIVASIRLDGVAEFDPAESGAVLTRLDWRRVRELVGPEVSIIIQQTGGVLALGMRELVRSEIGGIIAKHERVVRSRVRE